jgi:CBS domain-containing protein
MIETVNDIMCKDPTTVRRDASLREVARIMREQCIGDVLVCGDDGRLCGICTDRDLVVRGLAEDRDPDDTPVIDVCSQRVVALRPDAGISDAVAIMRDNAIRRVPILDDGVPVGILSLGDLACERDPESALGQISAAPPNS